VRATLALVVVAAVAVAGCHNADPCAGKSGLCLAVEATGSNIAPLDQLVVTVTDGSGATQTGGTGLVSPRISLPVQFAALLRDGTSGAVRVDVVGSAGGGAVAEGAVDLVLPASGHARVTVSLSPIGQPGDDMAGGGGGGGVDLGNSPSLTPSSFDLRVIANQTGTAIFTANTPLDVTLGSAVLSPPVPGLSIDGSSTCMSGMVLAAKQTCTIVVVYAPTKPASSTVSVQLTTSVGTPTSQLRALSPGLIVETLAVPSPPTFKAVYAVDPVHVWAVGDNNVIYRRDGSGWASIPGAASAGTMLDSVWAVSDDDVYVGSSGVFTLFRTTSHGIAWNTINAQTTAGITGLAVVDDSTVYVASGQGEITVGSMNGFANDGHPADGISFDDLEIYAGNVFAARAAQIFLRNPAGTPRWSTILDEAGAEHFYATWGVSGGDFYGVGAQTPCTGACGILEHKLAGSPGAKQTITGCNNFYDVWGEPEGAGVGVYAVGDNGTFVTTPGGDSWSQYTTGTSATLYGVRGAGGEIYAVGTLGTILHLVR
jgi:hypothetical protein